MQIIGGTIDDAAGEAFDKCAKTLGLPYPGGPLVDKLAQTGNANAFKFTEPKVDGYNFSFSGLKTAVLYFIDKRVQENENFRTDKLLPSANMPVTCVGAVVHVGMQTVVIVATTQ